MNLKWKKRTLFAISKLNFPLIVESVHQISFFQSLSNSLSLSLTCILTSIRNSLFFSHLIYINCFLFLYRFKSGNSKVKYTAKEWEKWEKWMNESEIGKKNSVNECVKAKSENKWAHASYFVTWDGVWVWTRECENWKANNNNQKKDEIGKEDTKRCYRKAEHQNWVKNVDDGITKKNKCKKNCISKLLHTTAISSDGKRIMWYLAHIQTRARRMREKESEWDSCVSSCEMHVSYSN